MFIVSVDPLIYSDARSSFFARRQELPHWTSCETVTTPQSGCEASSVLNFTEVCVHHLQNLPLCFERQQISDSGLCSRLCDNHPDAALLAANCVVRDCRDPNPEVKCLGVWGISVLPPLLPLYASDLLGVALVDPHPRVRRTAVSSCGRVFGAAPGLLEEKGFVDRFVFPFEIP